MRTLLFFLLGTVAFIATAEAQDAPVYAGPFNVSPAHLPVTPGPEAFEALDAALTALPEGAIAEATCPSAWAGGGTGTLTPEETDAYFAQLGGIESHSVGRAEGMRSFLNLESRVPTQWGGFGHLASSMPTSDSGSCLVVAGDDEAVLLVLQIWLALGWNLEFSALTLEAGGVIPLFFLPRFLLDLRASYFQGTFDRSYVTLAVLLTYAVVIHPLLVASFGAGLGAQRQSTGNGSSWQLGPVASVQLIYVAWLLRPMVQLSLIYLYETLILTPSLGVIYPIR